jgi:large repetitive protein
MRGRIWAAWLGAIFAMLLFAASASATPDVVVRDTALTASGVAVDGSGDVFLADQDNNRVMIDKPDGSGGWTLSLVDDDGLSFPNGLAVDGSGDVFIADTGNSRLVKDTPDGSGGYAQSVVDGSLNSPYGVAVDGSGNVFVADPGTNTVYEEKPDGSGGYTQSTVDSGLTNPYGVAVDGSDVIVSDAGTSNDGSLINETPDGSGGWTRSTLVTGLTANYGVAVDGSGSLYTTNVFEVVKETPDGSGGYNESTVDVGLSSPFGVALDGDGNVYVTDPGMSQTWKETPEHCGCWSRSLVDTGVNDPSDVALDKFGDIFVADKGNNRVIEVKPSGGGYTQVLVDDQLNQPGGVDVDNAGNVFIADTGNNRVVEDKPDGSGGFTQVVVDSGLSIPFGVAVDPTSSDLFVADTGNNGIVQEVPDGSGGYTPSTVDTGTTFDSPIGVAVDKYGNLYIADSGNGRVVKAEPNGTGGWVPSVVDSGLFGPRGVAVDKAGWVFVGATSDDAVMAEQPTSSGYSRALVTNASEPAGLATDPAGNVFYTETTCGCGRVLEHVNTLSHVSVGVKPDGSGTYKVTSYALSNWGERMPAYNDSSPTWSDTAGELGSQTPAPFVHGESVTNHVGMPIPVQSNVLSMTTGGVTGASSPFKVFGPLTHFAFKFGGPVNAGHPFSLRIYAEDAAGNVLPSYAGSPTWSDLSGGLSGSPAAFSGGLSANTVTLPAAYHQDRITVTDGSVSTQSAPFNVLDQVSSFVFKIARPVVAGQPVSVRIYAEDSHGQVVTNYSGSPTWSDSSGALTGSPGAFVNGVSTNIVTLPTAYRQDRITVSDGFVSSQSSAFDVLGPLAAFAFKVSSPVTAGQQFTVKIVAEDALGDVITNYSGTPSWSDLTGTLSGSPGAFSGGASVNSVTIANPHHRDQITVTDGGVSSQSGPFDVLGPLTTFSIKVYGPVTAGNPFSVIVYALDSLGDKLTSYHGTPSWSDLSGGLSGSPGTFDSGISRNTVTLPSPYSGDRITVTDGGVHGQSNSFDVH